MIFFSFTCWDDDFWWAFYSQKRIKTIFTVKQCQYITVYKTWRLITKIMIIEMADNYNNSILVSTLISALDISGCLTNGLVLLHIYRSFNLKIHATLLVSSSSTASFQRQAAFSWRFFTFYIWQIKWNTVRSFAL